jgi:hypothetical protein
MDFVEVEEDMSIMNLDFVVALVGDPTVLGEEDATAFLGMTITDEFLDFVAGNIGGLVVFVFDEDGGSVVLLKEDVSGFFFVGNVLDFGGGVVLNEGVVEEVFGHGSLADAVFEFA